MCAMHLYFVVDLHLCGPVIDDDDPVVDLHLCGPVIDDDDPVVHIGNWVQAAWLGVAIGHTACVKFSCARTL